MDAAAAIHSVLLSIEHQLKRSNDRLTMIAIMVFLVALPMIAAVLWFLLMAAGLVGAGVASQMG